MIFNAAMIYKMLGISVAAFSASFVLLGAVVQPRVSGQAAITQSKWTVTDLRKMATSKQMEAAVSHVTSGAVGSVAPVLQVQEIQECVAAAADHDIRYALLSVTNGMAGRKKNPLEAFARTVNAEELCATSGSAGADGLDVCVEHCERKPHFLARTSQKGACFMLCSVAIAPCSNGILAFGTSTKNWGSPPQKSWATSVWDRAATQVESMTPDYGRMVTRLEAMFVPVFFEGVRTVGNAAASPEMSVFSSWVSVARDALQTPRGLKMFLLLLVSYTYGKFTEVECRAAGNRIRETKEKVKAAREEVKKLRLNQLSNIRGRLLKQNGLRAWQESDAWSIYHRSVQATSAKRAKEGCRILVRLASGRAKRATAVRFMRLKVAAASVSAATDTASSEGDGEDGDGRGAG